MMKFEKTKKTYESPYLTVTELDAKDVIMVSGLDSLITAEEILGQGNIIFEQIEIDLIY